MRSRTVDIGELEEWTLAGAHWRLLRATGASADLELRACTGERVELVRVDDPATLSYVLEHQATDP